MRRVLSVLLVLLAAAAVAVRWLGDRTVQPPEDLPPPVWALEPRYTVASDFSRGAAAVKYPDGTCALIAPDGEDLWGKRFTVLQFPRAGQKLFVDLFPVAREGQGEYYRVDLDGSPIPETSPAVTWIDPFAFTGTDLACATAENGLMGILDRKGQWFLPPEYDSIYRTSGKQFRIGWDSERDRSGFLSKDGTVIYVQNAWKIYDFQEDGYALVEIMDRKDALRPFYNFIDQDGNYLLKKTVADQEPILSEGIIAYAEGDLWGFQDLSGNVLIPPTYAQAGGFHEGLAAVTNEKGEIGYVATDGTLRIPFQKLQLSGLFYDGFAFFTDSLSLTGLMDCEGHWAVPARYEHAYHDKESGLWLFSYDISDSLEDVFFPEDEVLVRNLKLVKDEHPDYVVAYKGRYAVLVRVENGKAKLSRFDYLESFSQGLAVASVNDLYGYVDIDGQWVIAPRFESAQPFSEGLAAVCQGGLWGYIALPEGIGQ